MPRMLLLQLKSGDSYLRTLRRDGSEVFKITKARHATYWRNQAFPVLLVIRTSDGEVRWMEIRDHLRRVTNDGKKSVKQNCVRGGTVRRDERTAMAGESVQRGSVMITVRFMTRVTATLAFRRLTKS